MSSTYQSAPAEKLQTEPTSPWTEVFEQAPMQQPSDRAQSERASAARPAEAEAVRPTQDALSVIFNPD